MATGRRTCGGEDAALKTLAQVCRETTQKPGSQSGAGLIGERGWHFQSETGRWLPCQVSLRLGLRHLLDKRVASLVEFSLEPGERLGSLAFPSFFQFLLAPD